MWLKFGLSQTLSCSSFQSALILMLSPLVCECLKGRVQFSLNMVNWHASCIPTFFNCVTETRMLEYKFPWLPYSHLCDWKTKRRKRPSFSYFGLFAGKQDPVGFSCNSHSDFLSLLIPRWQISGNVFFSSVVSVMAFWAPSSWSWHTHSSPDISFFVIVTTSLFHKCLHYFCKNWIPYINFLSV